jgi:hypothetical protein
MIIYEGIDGHKYKVLVVEKPRNGSVPGRLKVVRLADEAVISNFPDYILKNYPLPRAQ